MKYLLDALIVNLLIDSLLSPNQCGFEKGSTLKLIIPQVSKNACIQRTAHTSPDICHLQVVPVKYIKGFSQ